MTPSQAYERRIKKLRADLRAIEDGYLAGADRLRELAHEALTRDDKRSGQKHRAGVHPVKSS